MKSVGFVVTLALLTAPISSAWAQTAEEDFPNKPLRYIVPFPPGGSTDS